MRVALVLLALALAGCGPVVMDPIRCAEGADGLISIESLPGGPAGSGVVVVTCGERVVHRDVCEYEARIGCHDGGHRSKVVCRDRAGGAARIYRGGECR